MKKIKLTYMAFGRVFYETVNEDTPISFIHEKLSARCRTYHITSVEYKNFADNLPTQNTYPLSIIAFFLRALKLKEDKKEFVYAWLIILLAAFIIIVFSFAFTLLK